MMVTLGTDAHKKSHTIVAVDETGTETGSIQVQATTQGHLKALGWASQWPQRRWAIEDCRQVSRRLETELLMAGETVVRVAPKLMAQVRKSARTRGKSDPIDALATARAALREPDLPTARLDGPSREVKLLADYRERLIRERTATQNSLRWRLHELDPTIGPPAGSLDRYKTLDQIEVSLEGHTGMTADLARRELARIRDLTREANQLRGDISRRIARTAPSLLKIVGCAELTAAKLVGEAADITRFTSRDAYANWNGTPPIPVWSGDHRRHRLNRGGNRQTNAAIHRIAITQARCHPPAQAFIAKRIAAGDDKKGAIRALKRQLSDVVYKAITQDAINQQQDTSAHAA